MQWQATKIGNILLTMYHQYLILQICNFLHRKIRRESVESLSGIIDKLGRNRLGPRDKELKIMRLVCDNGVLKLMPRRSVVACDAEGGM
jgi:hypothetical protein